MSEKKKLAVRALLGVAGVVYILGGFFIPLNNAAQSYYHWIGADWHTGAHLSAGLLAYLTFILAAGAIGVAVYPPKALEPKP